MFNMNEIAIIFFGAMLLIFLILMYAIICKAIDPNDDIPRKVKRRNK